MAHITLTWISEQRFVGTDSGGHSIVLSAPNDIGVKPAETLLLALASCSGYDLVTIIARRRVPLRRLVVEVQAEQAARPPKAFTSIHLRYLVDAPGLTQAQLDRAIDLALNHYCTVRASLNPAILLSFTGVLAEPSA
ncbi:MAG: OsmC family protein [Roseiflexaceae bacterium]